jgi:hypothetical protein
MFVDKDSQSLHQVLDQWHLLKLALLNLPVSVLMNACTLEHFASSEVGGRVMFIPSIEEILAQFPNC